MLRLAHFSDIHLTSKQLGWTPRDLLTKKVTGWVNVRLLGRGRRFKHAPAVADALLHEFRTRNFDHLVFSGDVTKLAFESEFRLAAARLVRPSLPPALGVPGNHDYYTSTAVRAGYFEQFFAPWLEGERIAGHTYPFARKVGSAWLIGVNTSTANWGVWDASGAIGREQGERLRELCGRLDAGPRILVTHYPLRTAAEKVERRTHRLRDHAAAIELAKACRVSLWLHGHIHRGYVLPAGGDVPFPVICAGSCTQTNRWMYNEYEIAGQSLNVLRRTFDPTRQAFTDGERTELTLPG